MPDYKETLNLPKTDFPMKASLTKKEPQILAKWEEEQTYQAMLEANCEHGTYILHDGPPYANGHIHMGTALNKILKDIIIRSRNMLGWRAPYIPGWDCHGLPIEHRVEQELGSKKQSMTEAEIRECCRESASQWIDIQRQEFMRLGVCGDWQNPYLSMRPAYEATTARILAEFVENGSVVRANKPIYWCCSCQTALAEAEVEYGDEKSPSIYVKFPLSDQKIKDIFAKANPEQCFVVIWTTTPWTLPANLAICLHPEIEYSLVSVANAQYILASERLAECAKIFQWDNYEILGTCLGEKLEGLKAKHPFLDRESLLILGKHVTIETGSGCVHTAPGHGREDYEVGLRYGLEVLSPLDNRGRFLPEVPFFAGLNVFEANPKVIEKLQELGMLLQASEFSHSYPHCWRCRKPVIFRATQQWFISMEKNDLRKRALASISNKVKWLPAWGRERIFGMIESRPDWCISRQRKWGVPIMALTCKHCGKSWQDATWMKELTQKFAADAKGCDYWYKASLEEIVPNDLHCPHCGKQDWEKGKDILDVWFDSGTSWAAVLEERPELEFPADLYLEGSDQHRGWFHSSLLASEGARQVPPYKMVLTHGYVVDAQGRKMSKSLGNVIAPQELIDKFGAEIIRLWAASVDYREDIRISNEILQRLVDAYRRIRNTCRFILGNLADFKIEDLVPVSELTPLDKFALDLAGQIHKKAEEAYLEFEFHKICHNLHNFCVTELSGIYLDIIKDRLYTHISKGKERRSAQTTLLLILRLILRDMAPILAFTAEEIMSHIPESLREAKAKSVFTLAKMDAPLELTPAEREAWQELLSVRTAVNRAIEPLRKNGEIGHSLETKVYLYLEADLRARLENLGTDLADFFIVSQLEILDLSMAKSDAIETDLSGLKIAVAKAVGGKCQRCWKIHPEIEQKPEIEVDKANNRKYPDLCPHCAEVMEAIANNA